MVPLEKETNIEVLRKISLWLRDQLDQTNRELSQYKTAEEKSKQDWIDVELRDQLLKLQERYYGFGREDMHPESRDIDVNKRDSLGDKQLTMHVESEVRDNVEVSTDNSDSFPVSTDLVYRYKMSEKELAAESLIRGIAGGSKAWEEVPSFTQDSYEITIFERVIKKVLHSQSKYRLRREFNKFEKEVILTAQGGAKLRKGSQYSIDFAVNVAADKYLYHLPLERQSRKFASLGLNVEAKTLFGLCEAVGEHCDAIIPAIKNEITSDFTAPHLDETPWHLLKTKQLGYMWTMSNRRGSYFQFEPSRSGKVAAEILKGYSGAVVADGFSGYNVVKRSADLRLQQCWSHVRREFYDIRKSYPVQVKEIITLIDALLDVEHEPKSIQDLARLRAEKSKPLTEEIFKWLIEQRPKHLPKSGLVKAINYTLNSWSELNLFLKDLSVPLTNNDAERALRHVVMGRKNFNGSQTINGADVAASIYTVIESAKKAGINPVDYLKYLIDARWFGDKLKTPNELFREKHKKPARVKFPDKQDWQIEKML